jgi:hypothetical protein
MTRNEYLRAKTPYRQRVLWGCLSSLTLILWPVSPVLAVLAYLAVFQACRYQYLRSHQPVTAAPKTIQGKIEGSHEQQ